jgi:hypothetical protein
MLGIDSQYFYAFRKLGGEVININHYPMDQVCFDE